jgi:hypothetical protein
MRTIVDVDAQPPRVFHQMNDAIAALSKHQHQVLGLFEARSAPARCRPTPPAALLAYKATGMLSPGQFAGVDTADIATAPLADDHRRDGVGREVPAVIAAPRLGGRTGHR